MGHEASHLMPGRSRSSCPARRYRKLSLRREQDEMTTKALFAMLLCLWHSAGCEQLGIPDPAEAAAAADEEKAVGAACRHSGRALEDCYALSNPGAPKAAVFDGWRSMNDYMVENKLEIVPPPYHRRRGPAFAPNPRPKTMPTLKRRPTKRIRWSGKPHRDAPLDTAPRRRRSTSRLRCAQDGLARYQVTNSSAAWAARAEYRLRSPDSARTARVASSSPPPRPRRPGSHGRGQDASTIARSRSEQSSWREQLVDLELGPAGFGRPVTRNRYRSRRGATSQPELPRTYDHLAHPHPVGEQRRLGNLERDVARDSHARCAGPG